MTAEASQVSTAGSPGFQTLAEAVANIGRTHPHNGFTFQDAAGRETTYTFPRIAHETARRAGGLRRLGLNAGDRLAIIGTDPEHFVLTFLGALRIGVVPVPLYPPLYLPRLDTYLVQTEAILKSSSVKCIAMSRVLRESLAVLPVLTSGSAGCVDLEALARSEADFAAPDALIAPEDVPFLQYTSRSTAEPRGVMLTHRCLIENVRAFAQGLGAEASRDKGVTWLPLYHVKAGALARTSSGKLRCHQIRRRYLDGELQRRLSEDS